MLLETLEHISARAATSDIDLNVRVDRDEVFRPLHGGSAIVYLGTLRPQGRRVVVKSLRLSPSGDTVAIQVSAHPQYFVLRLTNCFSAHCPECTTMVRTTTHKPRQSVRPRYQVRLRSIHYIGLHSERQRI
jgi:hypothetical protein